MTRKKPAADASSASDVNTTPEAKAAAREARIAAQRERLVTGVLAGRLGTMEERVASILNRDEDTRNSDKKLMFAYWREFDRDVYDGGSISEDVFLRITPPGSITRARAVIQNTYKLFQASPEVRQRRGTLEEEERAHAREHRPGAPALTIFADESGKTGRNVIVASIWFLEASAAFVVAGRILEWRNVHKIDYEFHFTKVTPATLPMYKAFVDFIADNASVVSFKAISVPRRGTGKIEETLAKLFFHLLVRGVESEDSTGRAPLPRLVQLWKDRDEIGADKLMLADLQEKLKQAAEARFGGCLTTGDFESVSSESVPLIQVADLFAASLNRVLNREGEGRNQKDELAEYVLTRFNARHILDSTEEAGDMTVHISL